LQVEHSTFTCTEFFLQATSAAEDAQVLSELNEQIEALPGGDVNVQDVVNESVCLATVEEILSDEIDGKHDGVEVAIMTCEEEESEEISKAAMIEKSSLDKNSATFEFAGIDDSVEDGSAQEDLTDLAAITKKQTFNQTNKADMPETEIQQDAAAASEIPSIDLRKQEESMVGGEIMFLRKPLSCYNGWDNLRWMAFSGTRKVRACKFVYRYVKGRKNFLWNTEEYFPRLLVLYDTPNLMLVLRRAEDRVEFRELMELPSNAEIGDAVLHSHLFVESVIDPKTAKLRLSPLTTVSSILPDVPRDDFRRRSCFELLNPVESIVLSAIRLRKGAEKALTSFTDSGAFLETSGVEYAVTKSICSAYNPSFGDEMSTTPPNLSWKHQVILGTLHSFVVIGNQSYLDASIGEAMHSENGRDTQNPQYLNPRLVDAVDESGKTPLHYACESRFSSAVKSLVTAGANVNKRIESDNATPCHICAKNLDFSSLEVILSVNRRPNVIDAHGRSPIYLAITEGRTVSRQRSPEALEKCMSVIEKHGGEVDALIGYRHPVSFLAAFWLSDELDVVLRHCQYMYPLRLPKEDEGISISSLYHYPVHSALMSLKANLIPEASEDGGNGSAVDMGARCIE
jgi:hypothetical protein